MIKQCGTEVDVLLDMSPTCSISHLEMSALKAAALLNTTHHPKRIENNGHEKSGGQERRQETNTGVD
jgi:hypothetical protein